MAFNQSHAKVATGSNDSTVKLWNAKTGRAIDTLSVSACLKNLLKSLS